MKKKPGEIENNTREIGITVAVVIVKSEYPYNTTINVAKWSYLNQVSWCAFIVRIAWHPPLLLKWLMPAELITENFKVKYPNDLNCFVSIKSQLADF